MKSSEEHREHKVRQAHPVLPGGKMLQAVRNVEHGPEIVHKHHQDHSEAPEDVDGKVSLIHFQVYLPRFHWTS